MALVVTVATIVCLILGVLFMVLFMLDEEIAVILKEYKYLLLSILFTLTAFAIPIVYAVCTELK